MSRLKGSREGSHSGSLQLYVSHQEDIRAIRESGHHRPVDNTQNSFQEDLKRLIRNIEAGKYGDPKNWEGLKDDLTHLADPEHS